jgi:hypothetical protein
MYPSSALPHPFPHLYVVVHVFNCNIYIVIPIHLHVTLFLLNTWEECRGGSVTMYVCRCHSTLTDTL